MKLTKKQKTALKLLLEGDLNKSEIAKSVKVSRTTLYNWIENADFEAAYTEAEEERDRQTKQRIINLTKAALDRQKTILTKSKNDNAAAMVAKDVLDRAGYAPNENLNINAPETVTIINNIPRSSGVDKK